MLTPLASILALTGGAPPVKVPDKVVVGTDDNPIRFQYTFDDSDPDGAPFDFTEGDAMVDQRWSRRLKAADDPKIFLYIERIELEWLDDAASLLEDSQLWATVWDDTYVRIVEGEDERHHPIAHGNRLFAEVVSTQVGGSNTGTTILEFKKPTRRCVPVYIGEVIDLYNIKTAEITWAAAVANILGADTKVNVFIYGGAWMHDAPGADQVADQLKKLCECRNNGDKTKERALLAEIGARTGGYRYTGRVIG